MDNDKRTGKLAPIDELRKTLNPQQQLALGELELLGWSLKFVRQPLFQNPVPVVVSNSNDEIGLLDADGKIIVGGISNVRTNNHATDAVPEPESEPEHEVVPEDSVATPTEIETVTEPIQGDKRTGASPVPDNLEDYLNGEQLQALRQIENFGWQLKFVRRPMFQEAVAVIINDAGDKLGTLEADGRIALQSDFDLRKGPAMTSTAAVVEPKGKKQQIS